MSKAKHPLHVSSLSGKRIIALDLGRRTGWAVYDPKNGIERGRDSGVYELYPEATKKQEKHITDGDRFASLARFLTSLDDALGGADVVAFEQVDGGTKGRQTVLYNGYRAIVLEWATRLGKTAYPVPVHTIKRVFAGRAGASKDEVTASAVGLGFLPFDDNEADAIGCMHTIVRLSDNPAELERALRDARSLDLGQFKSSVVVEVKSNKRTRAKARANRVAEKNLLHPVKFSTTVVRDKNTEADIGRKPEKRSAALNGQRRAANTGNRKQARRSDRKGAVRSSAVPSDSSGREAT